MTQLVTEERVEAIIISGPRKGEFITVANGDVEPELSPAEEAMLDQCVAAAKGMSESATALRTEMDALLQEWRERNDQHELLGTSRRNSLADGKRGLGDEAHAGIRSGDASANGSQ